MFSPFVDVRVIIQGDRFYFVIEMIAKESKEGSLEGVHKMSRARFRRVLTRGCVKRE